MTIALLAIAALLIAGFALRAGVGVVRRLHVPSSVVAGTVGLAIVQTTIWRHGTPPTWMADALTQYRAWPATLIAIVFAGLLIEQPDRRLGASRDVARQAIAAWIVVLGQVVIGALLTWVWIRPAYGVPGAFGQLIEVGMAGGPGTARAMGDVYTGQLNFPAGVDLGLFVATFGLVWGLLSGIALARLGIRRGWTAEPSDDLGPRFVSGIERDAVGPSLGTARVRADVLDPLMLQALLLASAFAIGCGLQLAYDFIRSRFDHPEIRNEFIDQLGLPLFVFTTFGGLVLRKLLNVIGLERLLDAVTLRRLTGVALEITIVASMTAISLSAIRAYFWPVAALLALGSAWCIFNLLYLSPRLLPRRYWFELGLMNYGFATATTPQSMLLLRLADRDLKSGAAETYAAAVPLSAPFVGGGLLTFVGFPLVTARFGEASLAGLCFIAMAALWVIGRRLKPRCAVGAVEGVTP